MTTYYTFKERNEDGELVTPRDDPMEYEFSINFVWDSMIKALTWLNTDAEDWGVDPEESSDADDASDSDDTEGGSDDSTDDTGEEDES